MHRSGEQWAIKFELTSDILCCFTALDIHSYRCSYSPAHAHEHKYTGRIHLSPGIRHFSSVRELVSCERSNLTGQGMRDTGGAFVCCTSIYLILAGMYLFHIGFKGHTYSVTISAISYLINCVDRIQCVGFYPEFG